MANDVLRSVVGKGNQLGCAHTPVVGSYVPELKIMRVEFTMSEWVNLNSVMSVSESGGVTPNCCWQDGVRSKN